MDDTEPARTFLLRLLRQGELAVSRGETRLASRAWTSDGIAPEAIDACHRLLVEARRGGAVELVFGKGFQAHVVQRVRVADAGRLAAFLGEPRYAVRLAAMDAALADVVVGESRGWRMCSTNAASAGHGAKRRTDCSQATPKQRGKRCKSCAPSPRIATGDGTRGASSSK